MCWHSDVSDPLRPLVTLTAGLRFVFLMDGPFYRCDRHVYRLPCHRLTLTLFTDPLHDYLDLCFFRVCSRQLLSQKLCLLFVSRWVSLQNGL